jgi:predicted transcriptional regulator
MSPKVNTINRMLETLEEADYDIVINYIEFLSETRKKERAMKTIAAMEEFESALDGNRGWESEESMIKDMASFRKERLGL